MGSRGRVFTREARGWGGWSGHGRFWGVAPLFSSLSPHLLALTLLHAPVARHRSWIWIGGLHISLGDDKVSLLGTASHGLVEGVSRNRR